MDARTIPNLILQMAFLKLYIPLSLLTTTTLDKLHFNDGLKYQKILFGNGAGKYTLDISLFPNELPLSESEFWQAYCNWLALIEIITEPGLANRWRMHHIGMMADKNFSTWFSAWQEHNQLLHMCFMVNPFVLNLNHPSYVHQFECCQGDQTHNDLLATVSSLKKEHTSGSSNPKPSHFQPYPKDRPCNHSFHSMFCVQCGVVGHRAPVCQTMTSIIFNRPIFVNWKADCLITKAKKHICLIFNIRGTCTVHYMYVVLPGSGGCSRHTCGHTVCV